jgi:two-component system sensor histidine kinase KdpD
VRRTAVRHVYRSAATVAAIGVVTGLIHLLDSVTPVISLGAVYLLAIVPIAGAWGLGYAIAASILSMLALNFFFLAPLYTLTLAHSENWVALAIYLVVAVAVSHLAARARRRAAEASQREREEALLADVATSLLHGRPIAEVLAEAGERAAGVLGVESCRIQPGPRREPPRGESPYDLEVEGVRVGTLYLREGPDPQIATRNRFLPALASLLAVAVERDRLVGEAVAAETLRRSDAAKTTVLRAVSHDLRSPLTAIRVAGGTLRRSLADLGPDDRDALLDTVCGEAERLDRIVSDLLDLSRLEAGVVEPQREILTLDAVIGRAFAALGAAAARVDAALPEDVPVVEVDAAQLERVLVNLLENALRFSPEPEDVALRVTTTRREVLVRVVDRGPGIPEEELEEVFEPFRTATTIPGRQGAGLGLAIARGFAEANGGRLWAESRPGQGATIVLALPSVSVPATARP